MSRLLLLDTCAAIWTVQPDARFAKAQAAFEDHRGVDGRVLVSPFTGWEIGMLVARGRLALTAEPLTWFRALLDRGIELAPLSPDILIQSSFLPHAPMVRDPSDRIVAATARALGCTVVTRDQVLLDYAEQGWISALAC